MELYFSTAFADPFGTNMSDVRAPMTLSWARNQAASFQPALDIESDEAAQLVAALRDGLPRLKVWLGDPDSGTLVGNAPWAPMRETGPDDNDLANTLSGAFRSPFALLERRYTSAAVPFAAQDAGAIAWALINATNTAEGATGLRLGTIEPTVTRDRTYEPDKQIAEAVTQLTDVIGGFDFEDEPVDEGTVCGAFNVMSRQGEDKSAGDQAVVFEYGPGTIGNVQHMERETRYPVNKVRVVGANGLRGTAEDAASVAVYGTMMNTPEQMLDVSEQATLDAKAQALLQPSPVQVVSFDPDPVKAPQPFTDYWLGDTVRFRARHGCISVDLAVRVNGITLSVDAEGNVDKVTLTIDQAVT